VLLAERILATVLVRRYETYTKPYFTVGWLLVLLAYSCVGFSQQQSWGTSVVIFVAQVLIACLCIAECFVRIFAIKISLFILYLIYRKLISL
jgi:hypothetical protein